MALELLLNNAAAGVWGRSDKFPKPGQAWQAWFRAPDSSQEKWLPQGISTVDNSYLQTHSIKVQEKDSPLPVAFTFSCLLSFTKPLTPTSRNLNQRALLI